ncbi:DUF1707 domain-containing protein [Lipingzhangella sp. LS1_29]|uniref:DUF1707 domain-containing protein n=1 Tax=Lipingzhangella rawalii TaxID=2055835 RepID=A0ABU2H0G6_9ACTN|nr:DUF1707 domain-containing protein [Lipingzhangella rawalii]MDS1268801.1 DUF1707 domain-containing protein [Lipingzhangella rawalii]
MAEGHDQATSIRVSDTEREAAAETLRAATADGRLDLGDLDERVSAVYAARTRGELDMVTSDLPRMGGTEPGPLHLRTSSGSLVKDGYWRVPADITVECVSGAIRVDLTRASCTQREVVLTATVHSGSVQIVVPHGWLVEQDQVGVYSGGFRNRVRSAPEPGAPTVRIRGEVHSGALVVRHPRRGFVAWLLRRPH